MMTLLLATYNGASTLPTVLDAYQRLKSPDADGYRIVVVDNASTDDTASVLAHYKSTLPLEALRTERRGKNLALNLGLEHVQGDLVLLTDDDTVPSEDWLVLMRAAADSNPGFDIFGGGIHPIWPASVPAWIERLVPVGATYGVTAALPQGPVDAARVWGANMAVRRSVFGAVNRFDEGVGPQAGQYVMGSEVEFTTRMERLGHRAWHVPSATVGHIIRAHQLERDWIVRRAYRLGRHMFHQEAALLPSDVKLLRGAPSWKYRLLAGEWLKKVTATVRGDFDKRFLADWEISFLRGYLREAASSRRAQTL